jgi:NAD(P)-dependent dehydrogenase (short-subunit alcohol dehydrogenase family)
MAVFEEFSLAGKRALITGGAGVLCSAIGQGLARAGASVIVTDARAGAAAACAEALGREGFEASGFDLDVLDAVQLREAAARMEQQGGIDILINGAGGNQPGATTGPTQPFMELTREAMGKVFELNFFGAFLATQSFAEQMVKKDAGGVIINISSMNAVRPLTRIPGYSAAKAAVSNFTQWLAVHLAQEYNPRVRVNAIAPGFFLTEQNRYLLTDRGSGELTERGRSILAHTPLGRFGEPGDLVGPVVWLCSDAARFVTGIVVPVDGGFSAFSGV